MAYVPPTIDQFKSQFFRDFSFCVPAYGATAIALIAAGSVASLTLTSPGYDYGAAPVVTIAPPLAGVQATATATYVGGVVTALVLVVAGSGYTVAPVVTITPAASDGDDTQPDKVQNRDILSAIATAQANINQALFTTQEDYTRAYNLLAAHCLVTNIFNSSLGLGGAGAGDWVRSAMNVGDLGQSLNIPERITRSPVFSALSKSTYGLQYLSIVAPLCTGNVFAVCRP